MECLINTSFIWNCIANGEKIIDYISNNNCKQLLNQSECFFHKFTLLFHLENGKILPAISNNLNRMHNNSNNDNFLKHQPTFG